MSKALVKKVDAEIIAVVRNGKLEYKGVADPLHPGDVIDFVVSSDGRSVLVMTDEPISLDFVKKHFGEDWHWLVLKKLQSVQSPGYGHLSFLL